MATDYRRGEQVPPPPTKVAPKRRQNRSCVWWFLMGAALGVFVGRFHGGDSGEANKTPAAKDERPAPEAPAFQFERLVKEPALDPRQKSRPLPPPAPRPQPQEEPPATATQSPPARQVTEPPPLPVEEPGAQVMPPVPEQPAGKPGTYVVQIASVRRAEDAERLKAELAMRGIVAGVQAATLPNGQTTYRIRLGPYANKQAADQARAALRRQGKDGITYQLH